MNEDIEDYIIRFRERLHELFHVEYNIDKLSLSRGLPDPVWKEIMDLKPLSVAIPDTCGGRGLVVKECLAVLSAASYESLPLSLTFGINIALFLEPLAKYGHADIQEGIFKKFLEDGAMGGLMITEPDYGSDALNMQTSYSETDSGYRLKGQKHWQGLTGMADYWIVAARKKGAEGNLARDIDFFVTDDSLTEQAIQVDQLYNNLGLYMIPYGLNDIDLEVPRNHKLQAPRTGIKMMLDILHRSRMQFPGMGMGFIQRMMEEATEYCSKRLIAGRKLAEMDSIRYLLSRLQSAYSLCSGMCAHSASESGIDHDLSARGLEANTMKALVTDLMQESAQICVQLHGASGYRLDHVAGRGILDSRPFQIFEGSNDMLYTQISEMVLKLIKKQKEPHFGRILRSMDLSSKVAPLFARTLDFTLPENLKQRKLVILGKIVARLVSLQFVSNMVDKGFRRDLFEQCSKHVHMEIQGLLAHYNSNNQAGPVADCGEQSNWMEFI